MNQKEEENLIINYFKEIYSGFPKGKLVATESPDFILKVGPKKSIGIELTQLDPFADSLKEKIENTLENKSDKIRLYQQKYMTNIWLIIHTDFIEVSKSYSIRNKLDIWVFNTEFEKVFLFDLFDNKVYPLLKK